MESSRNTEATGAYKDDLSALAWVHEELRRSLDAAHKALRRFVKEAETLTGSDVDVVDPSVLRTARTQIHQGVGTLELVGLPAAATVLRACEAAVQRYVAKPHKLTTQVVDDLERASFALLDYLSRMLAGKVVSPLSMFPQYLAVQEAAGADRAHPADLWAVDWRWRDLPSAGSDTASRQPDAATRNAMEQQMLTLLREPHNRAAAGRLGELCEGLGQTAQHSQTSTLWKLAAAMFEAQAQGLLPSDVFSKRVAARLLAQLRIVERGEADVSERLAQDLLFFCAQAQSPGDGRKAPRLASVRQAYGLAHHTPVDYSVSALGKFDPALIAQARKRVSAAKESWSAVAGGEMHRMSGLAEQFALVGESLKRLFPQGDVMAAQLAQAVAMTQSSSAAPPPGLAMEVATGLLYVEASLEDGDFDHPELGERMRRLSDRIAAVAEGIAPEPLEGWMEDLYRRVSDRQTMGSVVQELRTSLSEAEKLIDQFFRDPTDRNVLIPVPSQLSAMRGVLSLLGMDPASMALLRMRDEVEGLISTELDPERVAQTGLFDRLAGNLGALGFLIDMLSVQPQMAKSLFTYDAAEGTLSPVMGRSEQHSASAHTAPAAPAIEPRLIEQAQMLAMSAARDDVPVEEVSRELKRLSQEAQAADQHTLAATVSHAHDALEQAQGDPGDIASVRGQLSDALVDFVHTASGHMPLDEAPAQTPVPRVPDAATQDLAEDDEMREIFLEEAREVVQAAEAACADLVGSPDDLGHLTAVRRAFHTLKGSSRMVGLKLFGDAAWACEQAYNTWLADQRAADEPLLQFTRWALDYLKGWVEDIAARRDGGHDPKLVEDKALALRDPGAAAGASSALPPLTQEAMPALELDADALSGLEIVEPGVDISAAQELSFELDLSAFEAPHQAGAPSPADMPQAEAHAAAAFDAVGAAETASEDLLATDPGHGLAAVDAAALLNLIDLDLDKGMPSAQAPLDIEVSSASEAPAQPAMPHSEAHVEDASLHEVHAAAQAQQPSAGEDEQVKIVGPLRISIPLFNIFLNEADELSRRLTTEVAEWAMELQRPVGETAIALAHSLAGNSATVGFADLSQLARRLEHALTRTEAIGHGTHDEGRLFVDTAEEIRRLLHQFAAGFLKEPAPGLLQRLADHELSSARRLDAVSAEREADHASQAGAADAAAVGQPSAAVPAHADVAVVKPAAPLTTRPGILGEPSTSSFAHGDFSETGLGVDVLGVAEFKPLAALPAGAVHLARSHEGGIDEDIDDDIDAIDAVDADLFPIFEEEGLELLPKLEAQLREWASHPEQTSHAAACMRTLHTLKGGARLAGAMRLGEMAHRLESAIERLLAQETPGAADIEDLHGRSDALSRTFEALRSRDAAAYAQAVATTEEAASRTAEPSLVPEVPQPVGTASHAARPPADLATAQTTAADTGGIPAHSDTDQEAAAADLVPLALPDIDWSRFTGHGSAVKQAPTERAASSQSAVRVRAPLLDRLVNQAGEVSITRSRIEVEVNQIKGSLTDLTDNLERLRQQLRDIELQAETQMSSRMEAAKAAAQSFDPLEFDRFTRFQELTRMMAESVNDVATVQRTLQRTLESTEDELAAQARLTRDLQDDLLRTRMVEFEGLSDRLYRVVRQAAKETGKQVRLDIVGGSIEVDRGVLDRMTGSFEHLLRNSVTHGIESPDVRSAAGKDLTGSIVVSLTHEGNEVGVEFRDDGAGLDLQRIREKGVAMGLLETNQQYGDAELANVIFTSGFSTADKVTELAGRGIGMDVVRAEVNAMGGRIETATAAGQGTSFKLVLPLTTAVTQVVMLRLGEATVAVPSTLVEIVRRAKADEIELAYQSGHYSVGDRSLPFFWLGSLLQLSPRSSETTARTRQVVIIRSAQQRIAVHIDEVLGNQEVVVKNLGPQLSRMPGLAGMTLLASGAVALIYNPVALATLYGAQARAATVAALQAPQPDREQPASEEAVKVQAPMVLVVDDSLTVRRVTQRLLVREGYRVTLAKDGRDALERLAEEKPAVVLSDIEMPRMDGFDLVRNIRGDTRLRDLPVIMITSRIAQKHRDYAAELGVDHYLGKPYSEEDLLALIGRYTASAVAV